MEWELIKYAATLVLSEKAKQDEKRDLASRFSSLHQKIVDEVYKRIEKLFDQGKIDEGKNRFQEASFAIINGDYENAREHLGAAIAKFDDPDVRVTAILNWVASVNLLFLVYQELGQTQLARTEAGAYMRSLLRVADDVDAAVFERFKTKMIVVQIGKVMWSVLDRKTELARYDEKREAEAHRLRLLEEARIELTYPLRATACAWEAFNDSYSIGRPIRLRASSLHYLCVAPDETVRADGINPFEPRTVFTEYERNGDIALVGYNGRFLTARDGGGDERPLYASSWLVDEYEKLHVADAGGSGRIALQVHNKTFVQAIGGGGGGMNTGSAFFGSGDFDEVFERVPPFRD